MLCTGAVCIWAKTVTPRSPILALVYSDYARRKLTQSSLVFLGSLETKLFLSAVRQMQANGAPC